MKGIISMKEICYQTKGTCSRAIHVTLDEENIVRNVEFVGGCSGNTQGVAALVIDMQADEAIRRLQGIRCGTKSTSCPDQLAAALAEALAQ